MRDSGLDGSTPLILRSVIALAHELGKEVVAEGVETQADAAYLRSIGCEYGQGYYYGEPMAAKDVASLLAALASHRKRRERERARAPAAPQAPKGLDVQVGGVVPLPALPGPGTVQSEVLAQISVAQAWPASLTRRTGSMPILCRAREYLRSTSGSKISSGSAGQFSQPLAWISLSSWPGAQPA